MAAPVESTDENQQYYNDFIDGTSLHDVSEGDDGVISENVSTHGSPHHINLAIKGWWERGRASFGTDESFTCRGRYACYYHCHVRVSDLNHTI